MRTSERRAHQRKRVIYGAQASAPGKLAARDCVVKDFSEAGAFIQVADVKTLPDDIDLTIARQGRQYAARIIWSEENAAGVAFQSESPSLVPDPMLEERLRATQRKMRKLKQRVRELSGEG